jgi:hypothetical protein
VVLAVVIGVLLHIAQGSGGKPSAGPSDSVGSHLPSASPGQSSAIPAVAGPKTPPTFVGSWTGQVVQTASNLDTTLSVHVVLTSGKESVSYSGPSISLSCKLTNTKATATQLTMNQIGSGDDCAGGIVRMRLSGADAASFTFTGNGQTASGQVTKS